jgi:hypothetical protein
VSDPGAQRTVADPAREALDIGDVNALRYHGQNSIMVGERVMAGPTPRPFQKAFLCAAVAFVLIVAAAVATLGMPASGTEPEMAGRLFAYVAIPAVIVGFFARRSAKVWPVWKIALIFVVVLIIALAAALNSLMMKTPV